MGFYNTRLNGIVMLTKSQYIAMQSHDAATKYIVRDEDAGTVAEYLGDTMIGTPSMPILELTQSAYDALDPPDANTLYAIPEVAS